MIKIKNEKNITKEIIFFKLKFYHFDIIFMFQKLQQKLQFYNNIYIDYFLINNLLSLILFKLNKITFQISFIYLFIGILLFVILFKNYFLIIGNKIKNTYFFNFILFNDLLIL